MQKCKTIEVHDEITTRENPVSKRKGSLPLFSHTSLLLLISIVVVLITPHFSGQNNQHSARHTSIVKEGQRTQAAELLLQQEINAKIHAVFASALSEKQARDNHSWNLFSKEVDGILLDLNASDSVITTIVDELTSAKMVSQLAFMQIRDTFKGEASMQTALSEVLRPLSNRADHSAKKLQKAMVMFNDRLERSYVNYTTDVGARLKKIETQYHLTSDALADFHAKGIDFSISVQEYSNKVSIATLGGLTMLPFVKKTCLTIARILNRGVIIAARTTATAAGLAVADGPAPFGDAIGACVEVIGLGFAGKEIYQARKELKPALNRELRSHVIALAAQLKTAALQSGRKLLADYSQTDNLANTVVKVQ